MKLVSRLLGPLKGIVHTTIVSRLLWKGFPSLRLYSTPRLQNLECCIFHSILGSLEATYGRRRNVSETKLPTQTFVSGRFLFSFLRGGMRDLLGPGSWRLSRPSSGRSAAALRCRPAGRGVSGQREHANRWAMCWRCHSASTCCAELLLLEWVNGKMSPCEIYWCQRKTTTLSRHSRPVTLPGFYSCWFTMLATLFVCFIHGSKKYSSQEKLFRS